jgi:hypothetical protein
MVKKAWKFWGGWVRFGEDGIGRGRLGYFGRCWERWMW